MLKKATLSLLVALCTGSLAFGQAGGHPHCATDEVHRDLKAKYPAIAEQEALLEAHIRAQLSGMDLSQFAKTTNNTAVQYHIPVVFHIVHDYGDEYLTDEDIYREFAEVNRTFMKMNADTSIVVNPYKGNIPNTTTRYIGKANIVFHLARRDPEGNPTNGVTRLRHYSSTRAGDHSKYDGWAPDSYLNIWVVKAFGAGKDPNVLAYAQFPSDFIARPNTDGVIIATNALGTNINNDETISHEIGHWLNLFHTWGNIQVETSCDGDDAVDDTPPTRGHLTSGCGSVEGQAGLIDTACVNRQTVFMRAVYDTAGAGSSYVVDTLVNAGINFSVRTALILQTVKVYPIAPLGDSMIVAVKQGGSVVYQDTFVVSVAPFTAQTITLNAALPVGDGYQLCFLQNPGTLRDEPTGSYTKRVDGAIRTFVDTGADGRYNYFYSWQIRHGYFKTYDSASAYALYANPTRFVDGQFLVDYPDTVNANNIMDYTACAGMFTHGQTLRMRTALTASIGSRNKLITRDNLKNAGIIADTAASSPFLPRADVPPVADFSVNRVGGAGINRIYQMDKVYGCIGTSFTFRNRSWRDTVTSAAWTFTNGTPATSTNLNSQAVSFSTPGYQTVGLTVTSNAGTDDESRPMVFIADDNNVINPEGYYQEWNPGGDVDRYPIFNYYNNQFRWEVVNTAGFYDKTSMRFRSFDDRAPGATLGSPDGDIDDFYVPPMNLSGMASGNCNLEFHYTAASRASAPSDLNDVLYLEYSSNCGDSWTSIDSFKKSRLFTQGVRTEEYTSPLYSEWTYASIPVPSGARTAKALFRFRYRSFANVETGLIGAGNNLYIDRIHISANGTGINGDLLAQKGITLSPNPTQGGATVAFKGTGGTARLVVTDVTGKVVYETEQPANGITTVEIPASAVQAKGIYLVQAIGAGTRFTEKLVVY